MARLLKFFICIPMMILSIGGCSFMSEKPDFLKNESEKQAEMAEQMLYERYGEEFVVESLGGRWGTATDYFYTCYVHPANNEELSFRADVSKDYTILHDEYARILGQKNAEQYLMDNCISQYDIEPCLFITSGNKFVDSCEGDMSAEEFFKKSSDIFLMVLVDEDVDMDMLQEQIIKSIDQYNKLDTCIYMYYASNDIKKEFGEWKNTHFDYESTCETILEDCRFMSVERTDGEVEIVVDKR